MPSVSSVYLSITKGRHGPPRRWLCSVLQLQCAAQKQKTAFSVGPHSIWAEQGLVQFIPLPCNHFIFHLLWTLPVSEKFTGYFIGRWRNEKMITNCFMPVSWKHPNGLFLVSPWNLLPTLTRAKLGKQACSFFLLCPSHLQRQFLQDDPINLLEITNPFPKPKRAKWNLPQASVPANTSWPELPSLYAGPSQAGSALPVGAVAVADLPCPFGWEWASSWYMNKRAAVLRLTHFWT